MLARIVQRLEEGGHEFWMSGRGLAEHTRSVLAFGWLIAAEQHQDGVVAIEALD